MKKVLLLGAGLALALPLAAQSGAEKVLGAAKSGETHIIVAGGAQKALGAVRTMKQAPVATGTAAVTPRFQAPSLHASTTLPEGFSLIESFEGWDGQTSGWLPEGWTLRSEGSPELTDLESWGISGSNATFGISAPEGQYMMGISFATNEQDEWLETPTIEIAPNYELKFSAFIDPSFLFCLDNVDWDNMAFIGEPTIAATLKVMVQPEGGQWTELWDAVTPYLNMGLDEILYNHPAACRNYTISLSEYAGKKVKLAFRYVGIDGNTMYLDATSVGLPALDELHYSGPISTLYFGYGSAPGWDALNLPLALYPVFAPITWTNDSPYSNATYSWSYCDPASGAWTESTDEELTVTYVPDYSTESSTRNNLFYPPILNGSKEGATPGEYQAPYQYFQAGGKAEIMLSDGLWNGGLLPFEQNSDEITFLSAEADFGELSTPITGYDKNTDKFWYSQTFPGETNPAYDAYVDGILNFVYPTDVPLVVEGANVLARGLVSDDALLTLTIYPLTEEYMPIMDSPLATATCSGAQMVKYNPVEFSLDFITVPFKFDTPAVLDNSVPGYIVLLTGFHSDKVEYFAPMQSLKPHETLCHGYLYKKIKYDSDEYRASFSPLANITGPEGPCYNAFCINLDASYGWLRTETEEADLTSGKPVQIALDSYRPGEELSFSGHDGITATATGRYGETVLSIAPKGETVANGTLVVSAPGHKLEIRIKGDNAGVESIVTPGAEIEGVYTLAGVRLAGPEGLDSGVYIVRYTDGTARKIQVK